MDLDTWIPMRWPCGPLELDRAKRRDSFTAREADVLRAWAEPASLELVAGTPVTCLVVPWAEGSAADDEQQRTLAPWIAPPADAVSPWSAGSEGRPIFDGPPKSSLRPG